MSNKNQDINVIVNKYRAALEELKKMQKAFWKLKNSIDPMHMSAAQELALFRMKQKLSEVSKKFYYARIQHKRDMEALLAGKKADTAENTAEDPAIVSDEAQRMIDEAMGNEYVEVSDKEQENQLIVKAKYEVVPERLKVDIAGIKHELFDKKEPKPTLCVCGHAYEEHKDIQGQMRCTNEESACLCDDFTVDHNSL